MQYLVKILFIGLLLSLFGCATAMSDQASKIRIITSVEAKRYEYIGMIQGTSSLTGIIRHTGYQNALNEVLDKAAEKGAEFVVLDPKSGPSYWTTSQVIRAEAFKRHK